MRRRFGVGTSFFFLSFFLDSTEMAVDDTIVRVLSLGLGTVVVFTALMPCISDVWSGA